MGDKLSLETKFQRTLLLDEPSRSDNFDGGGHNRTAFALASTIRQLEGNDRAIGLEGAWGAGKSTIVKIAQNRLSETHDDSDQQRQYSVFTFDLWSNQTEHFKRAFLESFVEWSLNKFPDKKKYLGKKIDEIRDKKRTVFSRNLKHFSIFGMLAIVFLYVTPILYAWLTPAGFGNKKLTLFSNNIAFSGAMVAQFAIGFFLIVLAISAYCSAPKASGQIRNFRKGFSKAFSLFNKEADRTQTNQSIRDEDPSQYEFTKIFREMVGELQSKKARIVVVFDNIDRLPHDKISDVWSQVRSAFYHRQANSNLNASIIAIVPYAPSVVLKRNPDPKKTTEESNYAYIEADVFRKSFDAIFHVSPPILSEASAFFKDRFSEATKDVFDSDTTSRVYRIFDLHVRRTQRPVTPRQVISFINDVTGWLEQWYETIPVETIAVFVANQNTLVENPEKLLEDETIDRRMINHANRDNIVRDLSALAYNVEPELALQILSGEAISSALISDNSSRIEELAQSGENNGFFELVSKIVEEQIDDWIISPETEFASAVHNLAEISVTNSEIIYARKTLIQNFHKLEPANLRSLGAESKIWRIVGFLDAEHLNDFAQIVSKWLGSCLPKADDQKFNNGTEWARCVDGFLSSYSKHHGKDAALKAAKQIALPAGADAIVGAAAGIDGKTFGISKLKSIPNKTTVLSSLLSYVTTGEIFHSSWPQLSHKFDQTERIALLEAVTEKIVGELFENDPDEPSHLFTSFWMLHQETNELSELRRKSVDRIFNSGAGAFFAHKFGEVLETETNYTVATILTLAVLDYSLDIPEIPNANSVPTFGDVRKANNWLKQFIKTDIENPALAQQIGKNILQEGQFGNVLSTYSSANETRPFLGSVVNLLIDDQQSHAPYVNNVIENYHALQDRLGTRFKPLLKKMGTREDKNYWDPINYEKLPVDLVSYAIEQDNGGWQKFLDGLDLELKAISNDRWIEASTESASLFEILSARNAKKPLTLSVDKYREPLLLNLLEILSGNYDPTNSDRNYTNLLAAIPPNSRSKLYEDVFERHDQPTENYVVALHAIENILDDLPFEENPERAIKRYLMPALKAEDSSADEFIKKHSDRFAEILTEAEETSKGEVQEFLDGLMDDDTKSDRAVTLLNSLNLVI